MGGGGHTAVVAVAVSQKVPILGPGIWETNTCTACASRCNIQALCPGGCDRTHLPVKGVRSKLANIVAQNRMKGVNSNA